MLEEDVKTCVAYGAASFGVLVLTVMLCETIHTTIKNYEEGVQEPPTSYEEEYLPGQPLDALRVTAPTFSDCDYCYKFVDRTSGATWWYVKVEGEWQVFPVATGEAIPGMQQVQQGE